MERRVFNYVRSGSNKGQQQWKEKGAGCRVQGNLIRVYQGGHCVAFRRHCQCHKDRQTIYTYAITYKTHTYIAIYREKRRETERDSETGSLREIWGTLSCRISIASQAAEASLYCCSRASPLSALPAGFPCVVYQLAGSFVAYALQLPLLPPPAAILS